VNKKGQIYCRKWDKLVIYENKKIYIPSYDYGELAVVYTDEENGRAAKNMHYYISTHITQAILWCTQGRIHKCFKQNRDFTPTEI